jgi:hypothetical protein
MTSDWRITMEALTAILILAVVAYGIAGCLPGRDYRPLEEQGVLQPKQVTSSAVRGPNDITSANNNAFGVEGDSLVGPNQGSPTWHAAH